jgi:phosphotriesterase-related protein
MRLTRRSWLAGLVGAVPLLARRPQAQPRRAVQSVTGPVDADALGVTLMHEHVLVDFIGAARVSRTRYDPDEVVEVALPHLRRIRELGCATLVECTPAYLGRDPLLLRRLSEASGLCILTNTGFYGAANDKHVPAFAFEETAQQIAARWIAEAADGIEGTGVRPAFMKIGVDGAPLSPIDAKLVRAAGITSAKTGLPIASHTGSGAAAMEEADLLERAGVAPSSFIWVHAQSERDAAYHERLARLGAWVEFDGVSPSTLSRHVDLVRQMKAAELLDRVLVSHDAGWYHVGEPGGGSFRPFDTLFAEFVPALRKAGLTDDDVRRLLVDNPARALTASR